MCKYKIGGIITCSFLFMYNFDKSFIMDIPKEFLRKEFIRQFKNTDDADSFLRDLHSRLYEQMLEGELDAQLVYEKHSVSGNNSGNSRNGKYPKKIQTQHGESMIDIPRDREGSFEPVIIPKHQSRGMFIERLVISLYIKGMMVSDIEPKMAEIYKINLSTSAIFVIISKVIQAALEWQNRPLDSYI